MHKHCIAWVVFIPSILKLASPHDGLATVGEALLTTATVAVISGACSMAKTEYRGFASYDAYLLQSIRCAFAARHGEHAAEAVAFVRAHVRILRLVQDRA